MARSRTNLALFVLVLVAGGFVLSRLDLSAIRRAFAEADWRWASAGVLVNLAGIVCDAARWRAIVAGVRRVPLLYAIEGLLIGWISNLVLPLKLGEGAKAWVLARRADIPIATVVSTVLLDRAVDATSFVAFVALASVLAPLPASAERVRAWGLVALAGLAVAFVGGRAWIRARRRRGVAALPRDTRLGRLVAGFAVLGQQRRLPPVLGYALVAWFARMGVVWCVMRAFHLDLPVAAAASVLTILNLGITAVAVPGNFGVFELTAAAALALWHVPGEMGVSFGIALHALEVVPVVAIGLVVQARAGTAGDGSPVA